MNCDHHFLKALQILQDAKPASGLRPETSDEWLKLLLSFEELGYACLRDAGIPDPEAREFAHRTFGSHHNLILIELAVSELENKQPADFLSIFFGEHK
jgi:hypothetical protein